MTIAADTSTAAAVGSARPDLETRLGRLGLKNPIMPASGCFGPELGAFFPLDALGAMVTKTVFAQRRPGNPTERISDLYTGAINSVGIPSPGLDGFVADLLPRYRQAGAPLIISVGGLVPDEYATLVRALDAIHAADAYELNFSCPNLNHGGMIGSDPAEVAATTARVRSLTDAPLLVKLTPVTVSIAATAAAAERGGADAVTVCNSFPALAIDADRRTPVLGNVTGGYSGRAVKPLALKLVHDAAAAVSIPVVGCGGIATGRDAAEFLLAGARAVQVGTANFSDPAAMPRIIRELEEFAAAQHIAAVDELVGGLQAEPASVLGLRSTAC
jgi:dihydroorotate dehydrogenase (NAD+) catalytic subunit